MSHTVSAGQCRVHLEIEAPQVHWDEPLTGTLVFEGGWNAQFIPGAAVFVVAIEAPDADASTAAVEIDLAHSTMVEPGSTHRFPFRIQPRSDLAFRQALLIARIWVAFPPASQTPLVYLPVHLREPVRILPGKEYVRAAEILAEASGLPIRRWSPLVAGDGIAAHLGPEDSPHEAFDWLRLGWSVRNDVTRARLVVNPREHSRADYFRALTGADRQELAVQIEADACRMREQFRTLLEPFYPRAQAVRNLPIAAESPADSAHLPRPGIRPEHEG
jgi:hypothetical protein